MNIWFMLWTFIAVFILGTSLWSYYILLRQKRAWQAFSTKNELEFLPVGVMKSPYMRGLYRGCEVTVYSDRQISGGDRQKGLRTIFQFTLKGPMPTEGGIGSAAFKNFINGLSLPEDFVPDMAGWGKDIFIKVRSSSSIAEYLTKDRLNALNALMSIKGCPAMLLFSESDVVLRIESPDPFDNVDRLERFLTKLADAAKIISL